MKSRSKTLSHILRLLRDTALKQGADRGLIFSEICRKCPQSTKRMVAYALRAAEGSGLVTVREQYPPIFNPRLFEIELKRECKKRGLLDKLAKRQKSEQEYIKAHPRGYFDGKQYDKNFEYTSLYYRFKDKTMFSFMNPDIDPSGRIRELGIANFRNIDDPYPEVKIGDKYYRKESLPNIQYYIMKGTETYGVWANEWFDVCLAHSRDKPIPRVLNRRKNPQRLKSGESEVVRIEQRLIEKRTKPWKEYILTSKGLSFLDGVPEIRVEVTRMELSHRQIAELFLSDKNNLKRAFPDTNIYRRAVKTLKFMKENNRPAP